MKPKILICLTVLCALAFISTQTANTQNNQGQQIFRFDTFGDEQFWTDTLRLHEVIQSSVSRRDSSRFIRPNLIESANLVFTIDNFTQCSRPLDCMSVNDPPTDARSRIWMKAFLHIPVPTNRLMQLTSCRSGLLGPGQMALLVFLI